MTQSRIIIYVQGDTGIRNSLRCLRCSFVPNGLYFEVSIWNITVIPFEIKDAGMCKENPTDSAHRQLYMQTTQTLSLTPYVSRKFKRLTDQMLFSSIPCWLLKRKRMSMAFCCWIPALWHLWYLCFLLNILSCIV